MRCFTYGSRVIENEQQVRLQKNVKKIGNLLHAVVNLLVTVFLFVLINFLLSNLVQNAHLTFVRMLNLVTESAELVFGHSAMSVVYFAYQHSFCLLLMVAFTCVYQFGLVLTSLVNRAKDCEKQKATYSKDSQQFGTETVKGIISYRHKVCFLS